MSDSRTLIDRDKLRAKRIRARLTQPDLAKRAGLHQSFISAIERGQRGVSPETLGVLADIFGCDIADLMPDAMAVAKPAA